MSDVWSDRAEAYRTSATHAAGVDLDAVVELCNPHAGVKALDVATGGGHVARRLREEGAEVVTVDPAPGMRADVVCPAEDLPFADGSFDVVVTRIAAHHFADIGKAVGEMARVSNSVVVVADMLYRTEEEQEAEKLRDPTHVRSLSADGVARAARERGARGRAGALLLAHARVRLVARAHGLPGRRRRPRPRVARAVHLRGRHDLVE